jgi:deltex
MMMMMFVMEQHNQQYQMHSQYREPIYARRESTSFKPVDSSAASSSSSSSAAAVATTCPICLCESDNQVKSGVCSHTFCKECIEQWVNIEPICPVCRKQFIWYRGNQPTKGTTFTTQIIEKSLAGHPNEHTIIIHFFIPCGYQSARDEHPGKFYRGLDLHVYLPDSTDGRHLVTLLKCAFNNRVLFKIHGSSVVFNSIELKTSPRLYPDPTYFHRVREDLENIGIK